MRLLSCTFYPLMRPADAHFFSRHSVHLRLRPHSLEDQSHPPAPRARDKANKAPATPSHPLHKKPVHVRIVSSPAVPANRAPSTADTEPPQPSYNSPIHIDDEKAPPHRNRARVPPAPSKIEAPLTRPAARAPPPRLLHAPPSPRRWRTSLPKSHSSRPRKRLSWTG
ncbi:unnamed protein product [Linum trigynum]|uniref:Uncharacterized protein n=1 Tax=Linum trigynum TaxID=586398 RepID=A0AAV2E5V6_9ROSI